MAGGAAIIDVKEHSSSSLGRADSSVWRAVRQVVPASMPVSVALGELNEWSEWERQGLPLGGWSGISFRKLGLAESGLDWRERWRDLRHRLGPEAAGRPDAASGHPAWVA